MDCASRWCAGRPFVGNARGCLQIIGHSFESRFHVRRSTAHTTLRQARLWKAQVRLEVCTYPDSTSSTE